MQCQIFVEGGSLTCQPIAFCRDNFEHLSGLPLADTTDSHDRLQIDILLGSDYYWTLLTGEVKRGSSGPVGVQTELGWVLSGPVDTPTQEHNQTTLVTHTLHVENLAQTTESKVLDQLKSFWELESFGITNSERSVLDSFQNGISFVDGRYEVCLPWKNQDQVIPDNYQLCLRRLWALLRRLRDKPEILREYNSIIHTQRESGIVEYVTEPAPVHTSRIHYLAHHAVVRHDKQTSKVRIVYDASARSGGPSLNDCLHVGPKFDQKIFDILLRFRTHKVALVADIEKAFLMVAMKNEDRDVPGSEFDLYVLVRVLLHTLLCHSLSVYE